MQRALVLGVGQRVRPQAGGPGVGFHQRDLRVLAAGQAQVGQRLLVDIEHRGRGAVLGGHVRDGRAIAQCEA
ncbi:hypothetical protein D3C81_2160050 [compost metagenome]